MITCCCTANRHISNSPIHCGIGRSTVPGARGGKASMEPAPPAAASSSSSSSSRFSSSPGARIFLAEKKQRVRLILLQIKLQILLRGKSNSVDRGFRTACQASGAVWEQMFLLSYSVVVWWHTSHISRSSLQDNKGVGRHVRRQHDHRLMVLA